MGDPSEERRQVLHYAAVHGRADLISLAIEQELTADGNTAEAVKSLLAWQNGEKGTALHEASRAGHVDVVRLLLLRGAPADAQDVRGQSAYQVAAAEGPANKLAQVQAAFKAELFKRCAQGDLAGAEALALGGVDLNGDQAGYTPWAWAELFGQTEVAQRIQELVSEQSEQEVQQQERTGSRMSSTSSRSDHVVEPERLVQCAVPERGG
ncbi:INVS [Symbiodinium natans]|uniref:INVS protein n=1 Tax=Symbiodinium natans TaxID=878477 RepID=A0A812UG57_9DINO|nr:INVS [Symbiodinium natans]